MNDEVIYTTETGFVQVEIRAFGNGWDPEPTQSIGWKPRLDGTGRVRVAYDFKSGQWKTANEFARRK